MNLGLSNDVMVIFLIKFYWYLGFCFIYVNICVFVVIIGMFFFLLNREFNLFGLLILLDVLKGLIWILIEVFDLVYLE